MRNLCTLFDSFYLSRALVMYDSLIATKFDFHLYIFAFDQLAYDILNKLKLERVTVISLDEFEDEKLLSVKSSRSKAEYCWTSTPSTIHYAIKKLGLPDCTYIDADLYFYASPQVLFNELNNASSALITEHRYTKLAKAYEGKRAGRFCVQFLTIKDNEEGIKVLETWRDQCIDWCYNRYEDGKFGDQKYLDNWPENYQNIHILKHPGGGVAPWNIKKYEIKRLNNRLTGIEKKTKTPFKLVFYHFIL
ncbi:MAG: glycosyl transferase [Chloroflexia bacterium]|nr:glycosyl transferase [Chloroflexia bacterium]